MSKYIEQIKAGIEAAGEKLTIIGSTLVVEIVERDRVTAGGIILQSNMLDRGRELKECVVLAVGAGYYDDKTGEDVALDTKVGDTIYCEPTYVNLLSDFPIKGYKSNTIGLVNEAAIKMRFTGDGVEAFRKGTGIQT